MTNNPVVDLVAEAIAEYWGDRCSDYEPGCPCCDAWAQYDALTPAQQPEGQIMDGWVDDKTFIEPVSPTASSHQTSETVAEADMMTDEEISEFIADYGQPSETFLYLTPPQPASETVAWRNQIANLSVWSGKAHEGQQLVDLAHVLAIIDEHPPAPVTVEAAAQVLLDKWLHGEFKDDADAIAQDQLDYGGDASSVVEAWLRALAAKGGQHE